MRSYVIIQASDENGQPLHRALIDLDQDINAQLSAFIQYIEPRLKPNPAQDDDAQAFALQAAVTAYRLCLAADAERRRNMEVHQAAAAGQRAEAEAMLKKWAEDGEAIKARVETRRAARQQRQPITDIYGPRPTEQTPDPADDRPGDSYCEDWYP